MDRKKKRKGYLSLVPEKKEKENKSYQGRTANTDKVMVEKEKPNNWISKG